MLPEFTLDYYGKQSWEGAKQAYNMIKESIENGQVTNGQVINVRNDKLSIRLDSSGKWDLSPKEFYNMFKEQFRLKNPEIKYIKPREINTHLNDDGTIDKWNTYQDIKAQTRAQRNNSLIEMMWSMLTNPDAAQEFLTPGGFAPHDAAANLVDIASSIPFERLQEITGGKNYGEVVRALLNMSDKQLKKLDVEFNSSVDPLSPSTFVEAHDSNMAGKKMIGIYANHVANHALVQNTDLSVTENGSFRYAGHDFTSLHGLFGDNGRYIMLNTSGYLGAAADNGKNPLLGKMNQNSFTVDATMVLSRLGYNPREIALLVKQPVVQEMSDYYFRNKRNGVSPQRAIRHFIEVYANKANFSKPKELTYNYFKKWDYSESRMLYNILQGNSKNFKDDNTEINYYRGQVAVAYLWQKIWGVGDSLANVVRGTRSDTQGGAAGPGIADTMIKIRNVDQMIDTFGDPEVSNLQVSEPLMQRHLLLQGKKGNKVNNNWERDIVESNLPYEQAFFTLGVEASRLLFNQYMPFYRQEFQDILNGYSDNHDTYTWGFYDYNKNGRLSAKTLKDIMQQWVAFNVAKGPLFRSTNGTVTNEAKRNYYINEFPDWFKHMQETNAELKENPFIKRLHLVYPKDGTAIKTIAFSNVGKLTSDNKDKFSRDWASMLYSEDKQVRALATGLFMYGFYRNGLGFGPSTYNHLANTFLKLSMPGYRESLYRMLYDGTVTNDDKRNFINQFILNNLDNVEIVPTADDDYLQKRDGYQILSIHDRAEENDYPYIYKTDIDDNMKHHYVFQPYMKLIDDKGNPTYLQLDPEMSDSNTAYYREIQPLGLRYNFLEYDPKHFMVTSQIKGTNGNKAQDTTNDNNDTNTNSIEEPSPDEFFANEPASDNSKTDTSTIATQQQESSADDIFKQVTGYNLQTNTNSKPEDISMKPNNEFNDDSGKPLCK